MPKALIAFLLLLPIAAFAQGGSGNFPTWPGQVGNTVGYAAAPGWPGSFTGTACSAATSGTSWANATLTTNCTYSTSSHTTINCHFCIFEYVDFKSTATNDNNAFVTGHDILFLGDRFQSNYIQGANVSITGNNVWFFYDSIEPLVSLWATPPGFSVWPGAASGANSTTITSGVNAVAKDQGYEIGIEPNTGVGPTYIDHTDIWGYGNAIQYINSISNAGYVTSNWIHDTAYPSGVTGGDYHSDGLGYLNGNAAPNNLTMVGNATAMLGNTNALALQAATSGYANIYINENYFTGDNATISYCRPGSVQCTNSTFYGNWWSATIAANGPLYSPGSALGSGSVWSCNHTEVPSGTTWTELNSPFWSPSHATDDGKFFNNVDPPAIATDQGSNTRCAILAPASFNFGITASGSSSANQTIVLSNTNSATLTFTSVALATGTDFTIVSNGCTGTLASNATCNIVVKFSPASLGPKVDNIQVTDNTGGVTSPQLVPLFGVGSGSSVAAAPTCSPVAGTYVGTQSVTLSTTSAGAIICQNFTGSPATNGTTGCTTGSLTNPVSVTVTETLFSVAGGTGYTDSSVSSCAYTINAPSGTDVNLKGVTVQGLTVAQ